MTDANIQAVLDHLARQFRFTASIHSDPQRISDYEAVAVDCHDALAYGWFDDFPGRSRSTESEVTTIASDTGLLYTVDKSVFRAQGGL